MPCCGARRTLTRASAEVGPVGPRRILKPQPTCTSYLHIIYNVQYIYISYIHISVYIYYDNDIFLYIKYDPVLIDDNRILILTTFSK
jgi:hypothetical protein